MNNEQIATIELGPVKITLPIAVAKEVVPTGFTEGAAKPPRIGSDWMGGIYAGIIGGEQGEPDEHLILLLGHADKLPWNAAREWAAQQNGVLPTRREQSLLFANLKQHFERDWYWSPEEHATNDAYAWYQGFGSGGQDLTHKSAALRAVAVRRSPI